MMVTEIRQVVASGEDYLWRDRKELSEMTEMFCILIWTVAADSTVWIRHEQFTVGQVYLNLKKFLIFQQ